MTLEHAYITLVALRSGEPVHRPSIDRLVRRGLAWRTWGKVRRSGPRASHRWIPLYQLTADGHELVRIVDAAIFYARGRERGLLHATRFAARPVVTRQLQGAVRA